MILFKITISKYINIEYKNLNCCDKHTDKTMTLMAICKKIDQNNIL